MSRKTSLSTAGQTYRTNLYNDLREEARASSYLLAFAQDTPDLTLKVSPGNPYFGTTLVEFAGGNSPEFTAPTTHPRIDILSINDSGTLVRTAGDEDDSPTAPAVPVGDMPIAQVYNRVGQTSIKDTDDSSNGYIEKDLRPFIQNVKSIPQIVSFTSGGTYSKPSGLNYIKVTVIAGGGGGGAADGTSGSTSRAQNGGNSAFKDITAFGGQGGSTVPEGNMAGANGRTGHVSGNGGQGGVEGSSTTSMRLVGVSGLGGEIKYGVFLAEDLDASESVTVGSGGSGASGGTDGGDGGRGEVIIEEIY